MKSFEVIAVIGALFLVLAACDETVPPTDSGSADAGAPDGGPPPDGGPAPTGLGPTIRCVSPAPGTMITAETDDPITIEMIVVDEIAVDRVTVNGTAYTPSRVGLFDAVVSARVGVNDVVVEATNVAGETSRQLCSYLISPSWHDPARTIDDSISMRMTTDAIDDGDGGDSTGGFDSLIDVFNAALAGTPSSPGLIGRLLNRNYDSSDPTRDPTWPDREIKGLGCDYTLAGQCMISTQIDYVRNETLGPFTSSLTPTSTGDLRFTGTFENVVFHTLISGQWRDSPTGAWMDIVRSGETGDGTITADVQIQNLDIRVFTNPAGELEARVASPLPAEFLVDHVFGNPLAEPRS